MGFTGVLWHVPEIMGWKRLCFQGVHCIQNSALLDTLGPKLVWRRTCGFQTFEVANYIYKGSTESKAFS
jgi:hypothetical protein